MTSEHGMSTSSGLPDVSPFPQTGHDLDTRSRDSAAVIHGDWPVHQGNESGAFDPTKASWMRLYRLRIFQKFWKG